MSIEDRCFNYIDCIIYILKNGLGISEDYFSIFGQITEAQKEAQKTYDYNIVIYSKDITRKVYKPRREIITKNDKKIESFVEPVEQKFDIIVFSNRNDKPDLAESIAQKCRMCFYSIANEQRTILNHSFRLLNVGGVRNTSFLESDEKDNVQRFQFEISIYYNLQVELEHEIKQVTIELQDIKIKK